MVHWSTGPDTEAQARGRSYLPPPRWSGGPRSVPHWYGKSLMCFASVPPAGYGKSYCANSCCPSCLTFKLKRTNSPGTERSVVARFVSHDKFTNHAVRILTQYILLHKFTVQFTVKYTNNVARAHYYPCNEYQAVFSPFRIIRQKNKTAWGRGYIQL